MGWTFGIVKYDSTHVMAHSGIKTKELYEIRYCECSSISDIYDTRRGSPQSQEHMLRPARQQQP